MSENRFVVSTNTVGEIIVTDTETGKVYHYGSMSNFLGLIRLLNEQESTIQSLKEENEQLQKYNKQLKERLEKINGGYGLLTHRNGLTANEWLIESQERELKKKNEQISDWIEQHSKDIAKICEQQSTIQFFKGEIDELKKDIDIYKYEEKKHSESARKLYEENEQLKKRLEHYKEVEAMNGDGKNE